MPAAVLGAAILSIGIGIGVGAGTSGAAPGSPSQTPAADTGSPSQPPAAAPEPTRKPAPESDWREVSHAGKLAHDAKDFQGYRAHVGRLYELLSGHPDTVLGMAKAEALLGHTAAALD